LGSLLTNNNYPTILEIIMRGNKMAFPIMVEYYLKIIYLSFKCLFEFLDFHKYSPNTCFTKRGNNMTFPIKSKVLEDILFGVI
jgi:hypothetical protein